MTNNKDIAVKFLRAVADAIVESVEAGGSMGTPGGVLYAALDVRLRA